MQCRSANFCNLASEGPDIIMHQLKSSYNSPFKDSYSDPIHTRFAMIASNGSLTLHGTRNGTGTGTGTGTRVLCSHCSETRSGTGSGKYYARMFTCPRNSSISSTCICFCCFTRLIKRRDIVNS